MKLLNFWPSVSTSTKQSKAAVTRSHELEQSKAKPEAYSQGSVLCWSLRDAELTCTEFGHNHIKLLRFAKAVISRQGGTCASTMPFKPQYQYPVLIR